MSRRHSTSPRDQVISQVVVDTNALATNALRYPGGFITNCRLENVELMEQAARNVGLDLKFGPAHSNGDPARRAGKRTGYVGIYLAAEQVARAPALLDAFATLQVAAFFQKSNQDTTRR